MANNSLTDVVRNRCAALPTRSNRNNIPFKIPRNLLNTNSEPISNRNTNSIRTDSAARIPGITNHQTFFPPLCRRCHPACPE
ncbi:MAG: hypothetical protein WBY73_16525, partial [Candidatus Acidiferrales bacterium]